MSNALLVEVQIELRTKIRKILIFVARGSCTSGTKIRKFLIFVPEVQQTREQKLENF